MSLRKFIVKKQLTFSEMESRMTKITKFDFRPRQEESIRYVVDKYDVSSFFPTGYGKTLVGVSLSLFAKSLGMRTIWLSPQKALNREHYITLSKIWKFEALILDGDNKKNSDKIGNSKYNVIIMTYEMFGVYISSRRLRKILFSNMYGVVIDEIHNFAQSERGAKLESSIHLCKMFLSDFKFVYLSATVGNYKDLSEWCKSKLVYAPPSERPVLLKKRIISFSKVRNANENYESKIILLKKIFDDNKHLKPKYIIFCSSRLRCERITNELNGYSGLEFKFHHAGATVSHKHDAEETFIHGKTDVIVCTPTLAAGVNTPTDICIMFDTSRFNWLKTEWTFLERNEFIQMIGRAGRFGISKFGLAIALCGHEERETVKDMMTKPLKVMSKIPDHLELVLLQWIVAGVDDIIKLREMYLGIFTYKDNLDVKKFSEVLLWLIKRGFVKKIGKLGLKPTTFGGNTIRTSVRPKTALYFVAIQDKLNDTTIELPDLFATVLDVKEFTDNIAVRNNNNDNTALAIGDRFIHDCESDPVKKAFAMTFSNYLHEKYKTDRISGSSDKKVLYEGSLRIIKACKTIIGKSLKNPEKLKDLAIAVQNRALDKDTINLCRIPNIGLGRATKLIEKGIKDYKSFAATGIDELNKILGKIGMNKIIKAKEFVIDCLTDI